MTSVRRALKFPHHIQIFVQSVDPAITVFDQNIRRSLFAPEVADTDAIRVDPFKGISLIRNTDQICVIIIGKWRLGRFLDISCPAIQNPDLKIPSHNDFVPSISINIINLKCHIRRNLAQFFRLIGRLSQLPQYVAL